ncbi:peptidoglycan D,D-transpeptidase FtsI family protein [Candidatus Margulisiibacteriota bacterium]
MTNLYKEARNRLNFFLLLIGLCFLIIIGRLFWLQVIKHEVFSEKAHHQQQRTITLAARRGNIYDSKNELLATSISVKSLYAIPKIMTDKKRLSHKLSGILDVPASKIYKSINNKRYFVWLKRKLSPQQLAQVKKLKNPGLKLLNEEKRFYLYENLASHLLGFTNIDNQGLSGIELAYNKHLSGSPGKFVIQSDLFGREIFSHTRKVQEPKDGKKIYLTIHSFLQYVAERELERAVKKTSANSGCAIILDPYQGDILAMASYPYYNPNYYYKYPRKNRINKAVETVYEPGSTFKSITIAAALNERIVAPDTEIECPYAIKVGGRTISDSHKHPTEIKTVTEILAESLNTGTAKIALKLGKSKLYQYIKGFGFGQLTGIRLPGESRGILRPENKWSKSDEGIIPFGHSIAVTPVQLISAIGALANNGILYQPNIIKYMESEDGSYLKGFPAKQVRQIITPKIARQVREMMHKVTTEGTGFYARIYGYNVAGKTGTAQKVNPNGPGYLKHRYISSFVGFLPAKNPKAVILVVIDDPAYGRHSGSVSAAPAFKRIAEETIRYLSIPPK